MNKIPMNYETETETEIGKSLPICPGQSERKLVLFASSAFGTC